MSKLRVGLKYKPSIRQANITSTEYEATRSVIRHLAFNTLICHESERLLSGFYL